MLLNAYNTPDVKTFYMPGRIWAGEGLCEKLTAVLPEGRTLVVADVRFASHPAISFWRASHVIAAAGEPRVENAAQHIANLPQDGFAAVIALGGGSTIDLAKAIHAYLAFGTFEVRDQVRPRGAPVLVSVPTTAGSGSETSRFFILSDSAGKRARRSWSAAPDLTVLDPRWFAGMPARGLVLGAFDAFCHLWETFICRNERSPYTDMLALTGIPKIAAAIGKTNAGHALAAQDLIDLQFASALGGQAISNVRTGLIHTLAESLAPQTHLSHPETLWVFYAAARESYREHVADRVAQVDAALGGPGGLNRLDRAWRTALDQTGIAESVSESVANAPPDVDALMANAMRDTVLLKENPAPIDWGGVQLIVRRALGAIRVAA